MSLSSYRLRPWRKYNDKAYGQSWSSEVSAGVDNCRTSLQCERTLLRRVIPDGEMMSWYGSRALAGLRYLREVRAMVGYGHELPRPR
jgi:hypothetical protein